MPFQTKSPASIFIVYNKVFLFNHFRRKSERVSCGWCQKLTTIVFPPNFETPTTETMKYFYWNYIFEMNHCWSLCFRLSLLTEADYLFAGPVPSETTDRSGSFFGGALLYGLGINICRSQLSHSQSCWNYLNTSTERRWSSGSVRRNHNSQWNHPHPKCSDSNGQLIVRVSRRLFIDLHLFDVLFMERIIDKDVKNKGGNHWRLFCLLSINDQQNNSWIKFVSWIFVLLFDVLSIPISSFWIIWWSIVCIVVTCSSCKRSVDPLGLVQFCNWWLFITPITQKSDLY